jgi:phosphate transport system substrate-binding protein
MNDEFLQRIRKAPPPEFLEGLKARLDRQSLAPPPRRRWTFTRGLLAGLMLGGAAFAITAVSLTGGRPDSLRSFVSAPMRFLAKVLPGSSARDEHREQNNRVRAEPLGPVWLPEHPVGSAGALPAEATAVTTTSASLTAKDGGSNSSSGGFPRFESLRVLTPATLYPLVSVAANKLTAGGFGPGRVKIELDPGDQNPFNRLCTSDSGNVDIVELARRITSEEYARCNGPRGIVEVKFGYQALALARAQLYGPLRLSARDLFLALARQIPDPNRPGRLIDNHNTTWNQVDPALPYDPIQIRGPAVGSTPAKLVAKLLLKPGCVTFPWIAALWESEPERFEEICGTLREDGLYQPNGTSGWAGANLLTTNPTAVGVFSLTDFRISHDGLVLNPIDGIEPTPSDIANGTYPAARPLYLYTTAAGSVGNQIFMYFVRNTMAAKDLYGSDPNGWGFVMLDRTEIDANLAVAQERRTLRF